MSERPEYTCPNCGHKAFAGSVEFLLVACRYCQCCGALFDPTSDKCIRVPERAKPQEVLAHPDAEGPWWYWSRSLNEWRQGLVEEAEDDPGRFVVWPIGGDYPLACSEFNRYVRAQPPIVREEDEAIAQVRSSCGRYVLFVAGVSVAMEGDPCRTGQCDGMQWDRESLEKVATIINRTADHLERLAKGGES